MISNRSVPCDIILSHVQYQNLEEAIAWLAAAFGFVEHFRYGDPVSGAQLTLGAAVIMVKQAEPSASSPRRLGYGTQSLTIFVDDVDARFQHAKSAGAKILEEPHETEYGEYQFAAEDLDGHHWLFSRHATDRNPAHWGAQVSHPPDPWARLASLPRPRFCYFEIPALDPHGSADFYEKVFGWNIRHRDSAHPSFDDASGDISGAWVTGREIARTPGLMPYIWVDSIEETSKHITTHGGKIVKPAHPDSPGSSSLIALFADPVGNLLGLHQQGKG
ncbi:MAG TPA: VOC family protein [Candidatus Acidoferrales bacterium]|nr:VOC family protein [Candidatus Acidoferrales bacterium]